MPWAMLSRTPLMLPGIPLWMLLWQQRSWVRKASKPLSEVEGGWEWRAGTMPALMLHSRRAKLMHAGSAASPALPAAGRLSTA